METYSVRIAQPADAADCVAEAALSLAWAALWIAYPTIGAAYLSDLNDDPEREDEYGEGLERWVASVQAIFGTLLALAPGTPLQLAASTQGGRWTAEAISSIDPELVEAIASFGSAPTLWTVVPQAAGELNVRGAISTYEVQRLIRPIGWWIAPGYKEPFLVGHTPSVTAEAVADDVRQRSQLPIGLSDDLFVPHRVRMHWRGARS